MPKLTTALTSTVLVCGLAVSALGCSSDDADDGTDPTTDTSADDTTETSADDSTDTSADE